MVARTTRLLFTGLVGGVIAQRLLELRRSRRNEAVLRARGAREHAPHQLRWMKVVHSAWLGGMLAEVWGLDRRARWPIAGPALGIFAAGQVLRRAAIRALGERWSVRILTLPAAPAVSDGIFRRVRHPNYLGVALEIAALPMVHGAWITSIAASAANGLVLWRRVRAEEAALAEDNDYRHRLADRPRWIPRVVS